MVISGIDIVALVPVSSSDVPDFANTIWITKIKEDGKYGAVPAEVPLSKGAKVQAGKLFSFEFSTVDLDNQATISTAIATGQQYWVFAYGLSNVCWRESVIPTITLNRDNKSGDLQSFTLKFMAHRGTNADIKAGVNLFRNEVANGTYAASNFTVANGTLAVDQAPNGGFTTANGKVFKLSQDGVDHVFVDLYTSAKKDVFPVKLGMRFTFKVICYCYGSGTAPQNTFSLVAKDSSNILTETGYLTEASGLFEIVNDPDADYMELVISDSDSVYLQLSIEAGSSVTATTTLEIDKLMLVYKDYNSAYSET